LTVLARSRSLELDQEALMAVPAYPLSSEDDRGDWPAQGEWTYEDYLRLPDDGNRYEVIRGVLYVTPAPIPKHQLAVVKLVRFFDVFVSDNDLGVVLAAPIDVKLPLGIANPVQPDVVVFLKGNEPRWEMSYYQGTPDLIVEVLSPGTRRRDRTIKMDAYRDVGVPEYWLVDPDARTVAVFVLEPGTGYTERCRGGVGETVGSSVLPGFRLEVAGLFPRRS
jgi:Uma2 family endonuclease